ncbi:NusA-like transcription termination signal-binding factor [Methermicoccus shengliensis]|uniref:Probable transcription termination protein NusA n=1 Tax=Methermicoccus shengliensis TaxID=660064 RepID=A0A832RSM5_9EURY|nr:NusA-like transcription termination signal-binding factor [Methermicoccus shengliensis]KUK04889.1 MAG: NusA family KH domain protein [Euryarchaeota archaeon 55_53]KUK30417.1 MAG: NusA family KH domain protein [Methanosarcinales archeaon 56_1174]MDI3488302.1 transcription termination/antitermination protein NusA [Methanosarcinales archaeon]MDN5295329.1 transcription termination/antitermination protein NusA [Methanosarcinales archaeon]HIH69583.1 NusA-like transcription termination signal-bind
MGEIRLTEEEMRYISVFEGITGAHAIDCFLDDEARKVVFVVKDGEMGLAIGKGGAHIQKVREVLGRHVELVEFSENAEQFAKNLIKPATVRSVEFVERDGKRTAYVEVKDDEKGLAIGKGGKNVLKTRLFLNRHHDVDNVVIE